MMYYSDSIIDASPQTTVPSPRTTTYLGMCNLQTIHETGKTAQAAAEIKQYNLAVLGLRETAWTQSGQIHLTAGETFL